MFSRLTITVLQYLLSSNSCFYLIMTLKQKSSNAKVTPGCEIWKDRLTVILLKCPPKVSLLGRWLNLGDAIFKSHSSMGLVGGGFTECVTYVLVPSSSFLSLFPGCYEMSKFLPAHHSALCFWLGACCLQTEPTGAGSQINLSSLKMWMSDIVSQWQDSD